MLLLFFTIAGILYYPSIRIAQRCMKYRKPFHLKTPMLIWNMFMAIMSGIGAFYTVPYLSNAFLEWEGDRVYCDYPTIINNEQIYYIIQVFCYTKIVEWIDTVFLILRKRRVIFLHWFHHLATYTYCLYAVYNPDMYASGLWFTAMNLFVHAVMYTYYAFATIGYKLRLNVLITFLQTAQMFVGVYVALKMRQCSEVNQVGFYLCIAMYSFYVYLFSKLLMTKCSKLIKVKIT